MNTIRTITLAVAAAGLAACSQTDQTLPLDPGTTLATTTASGTDTSRVSLPSGASVIVAPGSATGTLKLVALAAQAPTLGGASVGAAVSPNTYAFVGNLVAGASFQMDIPLPAGFNPASAGSLGIGATMGTATSIVANGLQANAVANVGGTPTTWFVPCYSIDLSNGVAHCTVTPPAGATGTEVDVTLMSFITSVQASIDSALNAQPQPFAITGKLKSLTQSCGLVSTYTAPCSGYTVSATASLLSNITGQISGAASATMREARGLWTITGDPTLIPTTATVLNGDSLVVSGDIIFVRSKGNNSSSPGAISVPTRLVLKPTASTRLTQTATQLTITNANLSVTPNFSGLATSQNVTIRLIPISQTRAVLSYSATVNLPTTGGASGTGTIVIRMPFTIVAN